MKNALVRITRLIDGAMERIGRLVSWLCLVLVVAVCGDVFFRYCFNISFVLSRELEWHLFALIFLLGAGYTLKHDEHVRVDLFYQKMSPRFRALVNVAGCLLFLFPGCFLVIKTAIPFVVQAWQIREGSPNPGGIPARYLLKAAMPLGFTFLGLQGISFFFRNLLASFGIKMTVGE